MNTVKSTYSRLVRGVLPLLLAGAFATNVHAAIDGAVGSTFNLTARSGLITTPDGDSLLVWGYALGDGPMQYPGPTLIVNQGDTITINFTNELGTPASIIFPGQAGVTASGGTAGTLTQESNGPLDTVTYTFTAARPGTYLYQSGTRPELQTEMGLLGALIVRPSVPNQAYNHPDTSYDYEYLFILTEMDPKVHYAVAAGQMDNIDNTQHRALLWFINGRNGPDTLSPPNASWLPHQPYDALARVRIGDTALARVINAGRDLHPFHTHGNHFRLIARDGNLLQSAPGNGPDLSVENFTLQTVPGATYDFLWHWTGEKLGWDVFGTDAELSPEDPFYGHTCNDGNGDNFDDASREYCPDHGKPLPVVLPSIADLTFGGFYSGSPFLGAFGDLPPGEGGLNANGGQYYMWHSHTERELTNNDIFPGGMMTMMVVEAPGVPID